MTYTVSNTHGCSSTATKTITVVALPTVAAIGGSTRVCVGSSITLTNATTGGTWSSSNAAIASINSTSGALNGLTAGVVQISYTVSGVLGCVNRATQADTVNSLPSLSAISGADSICAGNTTSMSHTTSGGAWSSSATSVATINTTTGALSALTAGTTVISYTVTNAAGCSAAVTKNFRVIPGPTVASISGASSVCQNSSVTYTDATTGGTWSTSAAGTATVTSGGVVTGLSSGSAVISYSVSAAGCTTVVSQSITVNSLPSVASITAGATHVCLGGSTTLSTTTTGGAWSSSNTAIATVNSTTGALNGIGAGTATISYIVTNATTGCSGYATQTMYIDTLPAMSLLPASGVLEICHHNPVTMSVTGGGSGMSYQWYKDGVLIAGATNTTYTTDSIGNYSVNVSNGICSRMISGMRVIVSPVPVILNATGTLLYTGSYASYQWYLNGIAIPGATSNRITIDSFGFYVVVTRTASGCEDTSVAYIVVPTGVSEPGAVAVQEIKLYPNPVTSYIKIEAGNRVVNAGIQSMDGKQLLFSERAEQIDVSQLAAGMYMIKIYSTEGTLLKTEKFVKTE